MKKHITVGMAQDDQYLVDNFIAHEKIIWPVPKESQIGDEVYLLIPSLTGSIIAKGRIATTPVKSEKWKPKYESMLEDIQFSVEQPPIEYIAENIPEWKYLAYARSYSTIPDAFVTKFEGLLGCFDKQPRLYRKVNETDFADALKNHLFNEAELKALGYFYSAPNNTLNAMQLAKLMGYSGFGGANFIVGSIGKKISERYMIHPDWWNEDGPNWWSVIAYGERLDYFYWTLKPQIVNVLKDYKSITELGFQYENDEIVNTSPEGNEEGGRIKVLVNVYERDATNRKSCIEYHGSKCAICGFDFKVIYGEIGKDYIQVHHIVPLNEMKDIVKVNPQTDLIPLCSNCHSMVHRKKPAFQIDEIKKAIKENSKAVRHGQ
jgi:5-methylcytosine-specific restriction protein A